jgi:hypothetical protein
VIRKPEHVTAEIFRMRSAGKRGEFLFFFTQFGIGSMAGVDPRVIRENKELLRNTVNNLLKGSRVPGITGTSWKKSISGEEVPVGK